MDEKVKEYLETNMVDANKDKRNELIKFIDNTPRLGLSLLGEFFETPDQRRTLEKVRNIISSGGYASCVKLAGGGSLVGMLLMDSVNESVSIYSSGFLTGIWFAVTQMKSSFSLEVKEE
jgi:hypothetical protein